MWVSGKWQKFEPCRPDKTELKASTAMKGLFSLQQSRSDVGIGKVAKVRTLPPRQNKINSLHTEGVFITAIASRCWYREGRDANFAAPTKQIKSLHTEGVFITAITSRCWYREGGEFKSCRPDKTN